jgi:serine/threonine-protein kinase
MGAVFKIQHQITKRIEAMKVLPGGLNDPEQVQRFEREIQVQARLHHPNIAALYTALRDRSSIALIMEYVEGESLQRMLEAGPLPIPTALDFITQVLAALAYAHASRVIHRDVAPGNIIITRDRTAKLTDFGLARAATDLRLTNSGAPIGSPWYMSPEQVRNNGDIDFRTDIYSTGAVLYEMITGIKPFLADSAFGVMQAHVEAIPAPPSNHSPAISPALDAIIMQALAKDPALRFQSAEAFRAAIEQVRLTHTEPTVIVPPPAPTAARPAANRTLLAVMVVAPALFVAGFGAVALTHAPRHKPAAQPAPVVSSVPGPEPLPAAEPQPAPEISAPVAAATEQASVPTARPARRASTKPAVGGTRVVPNYPIHVSGAEVETAVSAAPAPAAARPSAPASVTVLPEPPAAAPEPAVVPPPADPLPPAASASPEPPKTGNRFVRALGKINPFKKKNQ